MHLAKDEVLRIGRPADQLLGGVRAEQATGILTKAGFKDVTNAGGLADLRR